MKKGCVTYKKNSRNSELSLRNLFISQQIIDKYSNILDFTSFQTEVSKHTENAKKIGVDKGNLFTQKTIMTNEKSYYQASPNKEAFMAIDMVNDGKSNIKTFDKELAQKIQDKLEKLYPEIKLNITNNPIWEKGKNIFNQEDYDNQINFRLKAVETLLSDKAKQVFEKGERAKWDLNKILTELAIPKEQKQIILDLGKTNIEDITTSLLSSYSYTVEINTAKDKVIEGGYISTLGSKVSSMENRYGKYYYTDERGVEIQIDKTSWETAKQIFDEFQKGSNKGVPTQYHSNLTVPGGTNYKENEIATPDITPSIKGHAQFATDKGIGWFRSDDKENKAVGWKEEDDFLNSETAQYNPITKDDKIIFGHPTIGKSYLKQKGNNDFITLDDDYKDEVNAFVDANRGSETRQEYKGRKPKEYNEFMLNLFDRLKVQAKKEGKRLFVSNTNILKERMSEFDKVITIPKDEFKKRFDARGATYGFEDWKSDIDTTVAKVDKSKVISTTGYLSDLLEGNPKTRRILEVQSDLFQKGRDKEVLIKGSEQETNSTQEFFTVNNVDYQYSALDGYEKWDYKSKKEEWIPISYEEFNEAYLKIKDIDKNNNSNKFLQLLNKSNNWVTFFVKSIIQDSAKKGYEKVLFPSGETAAKVEGQETLAEELLRINKEIEKNKFTINKRLKEESDLILRIENNIKNNNYLTVEKLGYKIINDPSSVNPTPPKVAALINKKTGEFVNISRGYSNPVFANEKNAEESFNAFIKGNKIVDLNNKSIELKDILNINDLNDDLSLLESKEQRLFNIKNNSLIARELRELEEEKANIKSQGLEKIKPIEAFYENTIANILKKQGYSPKVITDEYGNTWNEVAILPKQLNNILLQRNEANKIIGQANIKAMSVLVDAINQKQDTLPHEYAHHYISWFRDTPIVQEGIKRWGSEEALVQSIGEQVVERKGEALAWWKNFIKWIMSEFSSLSELKRDEITKVLTDAFLTRENLNTAQKQQQVKPGVSELFESNPELANAVYEILGLDTTEEISLDDAVGNTYVITTPMEVLPDEVQSDYRGLDIGDIFTIAWDGEQFGVYLIEEDFKVNTGLMIDEKGELKPFLDAQSLGYKKLQNPYLSNLSLRKLKGLLSLSDAKEELVPKSKVTAEQKQQAQQLYSQYLDTKQPDVILPIGTSGSGKSTFIKSLPQENLVIIEPDAMRIEFTGDMNDKSKDKEIYEEAANRAIQAIKQGKQVVFDTTNLTKDKRLPFIEAIKKAIPTANIQYKLMELNPELAKQRIKAQLERGENRAAVSDATIDRHAESYKQMLEDIKSEGITNYDTTQSSTSVEQEEEFNNTELNDTDDNPFCV